MDSDQQQNSSLGSKNVRQVKPGPLNTPPDFQKPADKSHLPKKPPDAVAAVKLPPSLQEAMSCLKPALAFQKSSEIVGLIAERLGIRPIPVEKPDSSLKPLKGFGERSSECTDAKTASRPLIKFAPVKLSPDPEKTDHNDAFPGSDNCTNQSLI